ncbi:MAG: hypothetical protein ACT4QF_23945 [Sporichthyaceae bacterium]
MSRPNENCTRCGGWGYVVVSVLTLRHGVQSAECSCPECCTPTQAHLDQWRDDYRWQSAKAVCRHCGEWTHLRNREGYPAHWVCSAKAAHSGLLG